MTNRLCRLSLPLAALGVSALLVLPVLAPRSAGAGDEAPKPKPKVHPVQALKGFVGTWETSDTPLGEGTRFRNAYAMGLGGTVMKVKTWLVRGEGDKESATLAYETVFAWHPRHKSLVAIGYGSRTVEESKLTVEEDGTVKVGWTPYYRGDSVEFRHTLTWKGKDRFHYLTEQKGKEGWVTLRESLWKRVK